MESTERETNLPTGPAERTTAGGPPGWLRALLEEVPLFRQWRAEPWFLVASIGCFLVLAVTGAGWMRCWKVSPAGSLPEIRISGFDWLEARFETRAARKAQLRNDPLDAVNHWRSAVVANPVDSIAIRELVEAEGRLPARNRKVLDRVGGEIRWMLRVGRTNRVDLERAVQVARRLHSEDLLGMLVGMNAGDDSGLVRRERSKWLLRAGDFDGFAREARAVSVQESSHDPDWPLYWLAWMAGAGMPEQSRVAAEEFEMELSRRSSSREAESRAEAHRVRFAVALYRRDPESAGAALAGLHELDADTPVDHSRFWDLLGRLGRAGEARSLAARFAAPPVTAAEMEAVGGSLIRLGLWNEAVDFYSRCCERPEGRGPVWVAYGTVLVQLQRWSEVHAVATRLRSRPQESMTWPGYSHYLDGIALLGTGRTNEAMLQLHQMVAAPRPDPQAVLSVGADLVRRRFPEIAVALLRRWESELERNPAYWRTQVQAAVQQQDATLMLEAARREWELNPADVDAANGLAVALLLNESDPALARKLTRQVLDAQPDSAAAMIHHSLALLGDGATRVARPILESIDPESLTAPQRNSLGYARALLFSALGRPAEVSRELKRLRPCWLFPSQIARVERLVELSSAGTPPR